MIVFDIRDFLSVSLSDPRLKDGRRFTEPLQKQMKFSLSMENVIDFDV